MSQESLVGGLEEKVRYPLGIRTAMGVPGIALERSARKDKALARKLDKTRKKLSSVQS